MKTNGSLGKYFTALYLTVLGGLCSFAWGQSLYLTPCWSVAGDQANLVFGGAVANAGDVNGDGFGDIIIGSTVRAYVFHGSAAGLSQTPDWSVNMVGDINGNGRTVASAGDVNGDGYADVIVGSPHYRLNPGEHPVGRVELFYGSSNGLAQTPGWSVTGENNFLRLGYSVASAGDVNNDGYDDVIVGTESSDGAFLYYGSAQGLSQAPGWSVRGPEASYLGSAVASAGDVNGDGYADVLIGAHNEFNEPPAGYGRALLYFGSANGVEASPAWSASPGGALYFGWDLASAGDVNHDGYSDIVIGAYGSASAYVYFGSPTGPSTEPDWQVTDTQSFSSYGTSVASAGDVDGDGFSDLLVGASEYTTDVGYGGRAYLYRGSAEGLATAPAWIGAGDQFNAHYGGKVYGAGDVNGDGKADFIVSQWGYDNDTQEDAGRAFVYCGAPELPVVIIKARDPIASEPDRVADPATFVVRRTGPTDSDLIVSYSIGGTARNGVDYRRLTGSVTIRASESSARIVVQPLSDKAREPLETVRLRLQDDESSYVVGRPALAIAVIIDRTTFEAWRSRLRPIR